MASAGVLLCGGQLNRSMFISHSAVYILLVINVDQRTYSEKSEFMLVLDSYSRQIVLTIRTPFLN